MRKLFVVADRVSSMRLKPLDKLTLQFFEGNTEHAIN